MAQRRTLRLSKEQREVLMEHRDHDARPYVRERCAAILKIADGQSPHAVARHGLLKERRPDTVYYWLNIYETEGPNGLLAHQQGGPQRRCLQQSKGGSARAASPGTWGGGPAGDEPYS